MKLSEFCQIHQGTQEGNQCHRVSRPQQTNCPYAPGQLGTRLQPRCISFSGPSPSGMGLTILLEGTGSRGIRHCLAGTKNADMEVVGDDSRHSECKRGHGATQGAFRSCCNDQRQRHSRYLSEGDALLVRGTTKTCQSEDARREERALTKGGPQFPIS